MVQQAADESMVQRLGGRSVFVGMLNLRVGHKHFEECIQMRVTYAVHKSAQSAPENVHILGGARKVVGKVDFGFLHRPHLVQGQLETAVEFVNQAPYFDEVVLLKAIDVFRDVVPHLRVNVAGAVPQRKRQVEFTVL